MTNASEFRRWCWRVALLMRKGISFRCAIHMADVAAELDRAMARAEIHPARVSTGGVA